MIGIEIYFVPTGRFKVGRMVLYQCLIPKGIASKTVAVCFVPTGRFKAGRIFLYQYLIPKGIANTKMRDFFFYTKSLM